MCSVHIGLNTVFDFFLQRKNVLKKSAKNHEKRMEKVKQQIASGQNKNS